MATLVSGYGTDALGITPSVLVVLMTILVALGILADVAMA